VATAARDLAKSHRGISSGIDLEASGPAVSVRANVPHRSDSGRGRKSVIVGDGGAHVRFRSMSGDVTISPPFSSRRSGDKSASAGSGGSAAFVGGIGNIAEQVARGVEAASRRAEAASRRAEVMARQFESVGRRMESIGREPFANADAPRSFGFGRSAADAAPVEPAPRPARARASGAGPDAPTDQMAILRALERGEIDVAEATRLLSEAS